MIKSKTKKQNSNDTKTKTKKRKPGSGGARPGAGRKPLEYESITFVINPPVELLKAMDYADISNKTAFICQLVAKDLAKRTNGITQTKMKEFVSHFKTVKIFINEQK